MRINANFKIVLLPFLLISITPSLFVGINAQINWLSFRSNPFLEPTRVSRQIRPRERAGFSFFREFIATIPGVINDILPTLSEDDPIVETTNGLIRGMTKLSRDGRPYSAFLGVPYAVPPVGQLRFEPPQKLTKRWGGVRNADRYSPPCFHFDSFVTLRETGREDCLRANIYTPSLDEKLPVIVYIHGGGFSSGSGDFFQGKYFMDEDVVLVVFNYRLSALGFLNTGADGKIRGNMGLKDQNMMLQWVQENILHFGGDPEQVTIFGESAGAASVGYHILSPRSKGLFHRAIASSGTPLAPWALLENPAKSARNLAIAAGCPTINSDLMIQCLKSISPQDIAKGYKGLLKTISSPAEFFVPSIETVLTEDTMLSEHPRNLLKRGDFNKVSLMLGVCEMEGLIHTSRILADQYVKENLGRRWNDWIPVILRYDPKNITRSNMLKSFYFPSLNGDLDLSNRENFINLTNLFSDALFKKPSHQMAQAFKKHAPLYLYYYTYQGRFAVHDILSKVPVLSEVDNELPRISEVTFGPQFLSGLLRYGLTNERLSDLGAGHGDSTLLLFNIRRAPGIGVLSMDYEMSKAMVKSLAGFASSKRFVSFDQVAWPKANKNNSYNMKHMLLDLPARVISDPFEFEDENIL